MLEPAAAREPNPTDRTSPIRAKALTEWHCDSAGCHPPGDRGVTEAIAGSRAGETRKKSSARHGRLSRRSGVRRDGAICAISSFGSVATTTSPRQNGQPPQWRRRGALRTLACSTRPALRDGATHCCAVDRTDAGNRCARREPARRQSWPPRWARGAALTTRYGGYQIDGAVELPEGVWCITGRGVNLKEAVDFLGAVTVGDISSVWVDVELIDGRAGSVRDLDRTRTASFRTRPARV